MSFAKFFIAFKQHSLLQRKERRKKRKCKKIQSMRKRKKKRTQEWKSRILFLPHLFQGPAPPFSRPHLIPGTARCVPRLSSDESTADCRQLRCFRSSAGGGGISKFVLTRCLFILFRCEFLDLFLLIFSLCSFSISFPLLLGRSFSFPLSHWTQEGRKEERNHTSWNERMKEWRNGWMEQEDVMKKSSRKKPRPNTHIHGPKTMKTRHQEQTMKWRMKWRRNRKLTERVQGCLIIDLRYFIAWSGGIVMLFKDDPSTTFAWTWRRNMNRN